MRSGTELSQFLRVFIPTPSLSECHTDTVYENLSLPTL